MEVDGYAQEVAGGAQETAAFPVGKRCYVGNLAWKTSWQDLKDKFRENGNVVYANVMRDDGGRSKGWGIVEFETAEEAVAAINSQNGADLGGRRILVREDREDRDVKQAGADGEAPRERAPRPPREPREGGRGRGEGGNGGRGRGEGGRGSGGRGGGRGADRTGESSGLQVVVQGIPWSYTWKELKDLFADISDIERADVATGYDGRSRGFGTIRFSTPEGAQAAIGKWNEQELEGRKLAVFLDKFA